MLFGVDKHAGEFINEFDKYATFGSTKMDKGSKAIKKSPALLDLVGCILAPFLVFVVILWVRSFSEHYTSESFMDMMSYCFLIVPLAAGIQAFNMRRTGDPKPMLLLAVMAGFAWTLGVFMGDYNFHWNMKPFYDIRQLNVYPSVDPSKYGGQSFMDAGIIEFAPGTKLLPQKSMGFKNGDVYCVAPVVSNSTSATSLNKSTIDFWAVGVNCCSGRVPDFHCGEYSNPKSMKGLRLMDEDKREMFRLVVKKAQAEFNLKVSHPIFLYWLSDPEAEIHAYQDDGWQYVVTASFAFLCAQLFVVVCAATAFARM